MEIVVATAIASVVLVALSALMSENVREVMKFERSNEGWLEAVSGAADLNLALKNVPRLDPPEDLLKTGDRLFSGVTNVPDGFAPAVCRSGPGFAMLRFTSLNRQQPSERILRPWLTSSAGQGGAANELRITATDGRSAFLKANPPRELFLVDADNFAKRRYKVVSFENRNTNLNPYDDQPVNGATFRYTAVLLASPKGLGGITMEPIDNKFVSSSMVFPSRTAIVCMSKEGSLIETDEEGNTRTLMNIFASRLVAERFLVEFAGSASATRVDLLPFFPDLITSLTRDCLNMVRFRVNILNPVGGANDPRNRLELERLVLLNNLHSTRPLSCN